VSRDPLLDPWHGERFRLRTGVEVRLHAPGTSEARYTLIGADGLRHPLRGLTELRRLLVGATVLPVPMGLP
jgi:hypothetical protein